MKKVEIQELLEIKDKYVRENKELKELKKEMLELRADYEALNARYDILLNKWKNIKIKKIIGSYYKIAGMVE